MRKGLKKGSGVAPNLWAWLQANPDEELTPAQVAIRFDCSMKAAYEAVRFLQRSGKDVESVHVVRLSAKGRRFEVCTVTIPTQTWLADRPDLQGGP